MIDKLYSVFMQRVLICSCSCLEKFFHTKCEEPGLILYLCVFVCRSIMTDLYYLSQADGVGEWRMKEAKDLSDLVQNRITYLQVSAHTPAVCTYSHTFVLSATSFTPFCLICTIHSCSTRYRYGFL